MKKRISLAATFASAVMLSASIIEWELPSLTDGNGNDLTVSADNIVFLISSGADSNGVFTDAQVVAGDNTIDDQDSTYVAGTFESDDPLSAGTYYIAYANDGKYYAIDTGNGAASVVARDTSSADPRTPPVSGLSSGVAGSISYSDYAVDDNGKVSTFAASVPEPATAAMALVGVAMLLRRRRVA